MVVAATLLAGGLGLLTASGWLLVRSASRLARALGVAPLMIGVTVVAFGTSMPEFFVSVAGSLAGSPGIAAGNVIGSNIANVLLVLGLASVITPLAVHRRLIRLDIPVLIGVTGLVLLAGLDGRISRMEGAIGLVALLAFTGAQVRWFAAPEERVAGGPAISRARAGTGWEVMLLVASVAGLAAGSTLFVDGASELAGRAGVSEFAIGATVVAVGTSLPEVVTSVVAAIRREVDIAVANVVGSNLFNALGVLGGAAVAAPLTVERALYGFELPVLAVTAVILLPLVRTGYRLSRAEGAILLAGFVAFTVVTLLRGM